MQEVEVDQNVTGRPAIAPCAADTFALAWLSAASHGALKAAVFSSTGARLAENFPINTPETATTSFPVMSIVMQGFAVAWTAGNNVLLQSFSTDGAAVSDAIQVNSTPADTNNPPAIARLADATVVVSWGEADAEAGVRAQRFGPDLSKLGAEFSVSTTPGVHFSPAVTALDDGGFVVGWQGGPNFGSEAGRFRVFNPDGSESVPEQLAKHGLDPGPATLAPVPQGQFAAVRIQDELGGLDRENILAVSLYGADGSFIADSPLTLQHSQTISHFPTIRATPTNGLVVAWTERMVPTTGIFGQTIKAMSLGSDLTQGASVNVNTAARRGQDTPCVTPVVTESGDVAAFAWIDAPLSPQPGQPSLKMRMMPSDLVGP
jgi:hypothetical protein